MTRYLHGLVTCFFRPIDRRLLPNKPDLKTGCKCAHFDLFTNAVNRLYLCCFGCVLCRLMQLTPLADVFSN